MSKFQAPPPYTRLSKLTAIYTHIDKQIMHDNMIINNIQKLVSNTKILSSSKYKERFKIY